MQLTWWKREITPVVLEPDNVGFDPEDVAALRAMTQRAKVSVVEDNASPPMASPPPAVSKTAAPRSTQLNVRVRSETRQRVQALVARERTSLAEVVERAIDQLFTRDSGSPR